MKNLIMRKNKEPGEYENDFYYRCQHRKKIDEKHFYDFRLPINQSELNPEVENLILDMVANGRCYLRGG